MWKSYGGIVRRYPKISLSEERQLILRAQKGSKKSKDELVLRHLGFLIFRIYKIAFPSLIRSFGEDLLAEAILIVYKKIESYDLNYRDKHGNSKPVKFTSYIWKRIDGFIIDSLKKELNESNFYNRYNEYTLKSEDSSSMFWSTEMDNSIV
jgi:DNA-directed RNA polymerase specialized sigma subunit